MSVTALPRARRRLANRRPHEIREIEFRGRRYVVGVGRFEGGGLAEIFIDASKQSSDAADDARDTAIAVSLAMQHGTPPEAIRGALIRGPNGEPSSILAATLDLLTAEERQ